MGWVLGKRESKPPADDAEKTQMKAGKKLVLSCLHLRLLRVICGPV